MYTYTGSRNFYGDLTNNAQTTNLALGDKLINQATRKLLALAKWPFRNREYTVTTVASQQAYQVSAYIEKVLACKITIGGTSYTVRECPSLETWYRLNSTLVTSDIPEYFVLLNGQIQFYPIPASAGNTITLAGRLAIKDLSIADYTTGTITTLAAAGTAVTGSGSTWTAGMAGRYIQFNEATGGDGRWYEIASVTDGTHLVLTKPYGGTAIAAGSVTYTIGQVSLIPENYQDIPVLEAVRAYYELVQPDATRADGAKQMADERTLQFLADWQSMSEKVVIEEIGADLPNPNDYIWAT